MELGKDTVTWTTAVNFFEKDGQQSDHVRECLPYEKAGDDIVNAGKVCSRYNCYKIHNGHWDFEEGGDTGYVIHTKGKLFCLSRESLGLTYSRKEDAKYEEAWAGD